MCFRIIRRESQARRCVDKDLSLHTQTGNLPVRWNRKTLWRHGREAGADTGTVWYTGYCRKGQGLDEPVLLEKDMDHLRTQY